VAELPHVPLGFGHKNYPALAVSHLKHRTSSACVM
jgi:hypothetical protein